MSYIADLHIHSRFSRACSPRLTIPNLAQAAKLKGISLLGTGDFLHHLWFAELKRDLKEVGSGLYEHGGVNFVLSCEVSLIYSHLGKGRRIHLVVCFPSLEDVENLHGQLSKKGAKLSSDGRPILGMSTQAFCEIVFNINALAIIIPAHCLLPSTLVHTSTGMKAIQNIQVGELVYTHKNRKRQVTKIFRHQHHGKLYKVQPWYFSLGVETTSEHPFLAFKLKYCPSTGDKCLPSGSHKKVCQHRLFKSYLPEWLLAKNLQVGDILTFPRFSKTTPLQVLEIDQILPYKPDNGLVYTGRSRGHIFNNDIKINEDFCRLVGYYLAEGWISNAKGSLGFCFSKNETEYVDDVKELVKSVFGILLCRTYQRPDTDSIELIFSSKLLSELFASLFYSKVPYNAKNKTLPDWILHLPINLQAQILLGWWRGDKGYTVSRLLMNQMKVICLRLGIIPSIGVELAADHLKRGNHQYKNRVINASADLYHFSYLAFFEDSSNLLSDAAFTECRRKLNRRHGWVDKDYVYLPIRKIATRDYTGDIINLEVEEDNSYVTESATVHNCWTPWFGMFGSQSGYDNLDDCFGSFADKIYAIETGLSSDPAMNWRVGQLDNKSIVSFSDLHSLSKMGREATVFKSDLKLGYTGLLKDLKEQRIEETIEFYPEEGKYHYDGHRNCNFSQGPEKTRQNGIVCPVCGKDLTIGVMFRVDKLATRTEGKVKVLKRPGYRMLVPLLEIIAETLHTGLSSQRVGNEYKKLTGSLGPEIEILTSISLDQIAKISGEKVAKAVGKVRNGDLMIKPGFDGVYGVVKIWENDKEEIKNPQIELFE